jgi:hypothetical protein
VLAVVLSALAIGLVAGYEIKTPEQVVQMQTRTQTISSQVTVQIIRSLTQEVTEVVTVTVSVQAVSTHQAGQILWHSYDWRDPSTLIIRLGVAAAEPVTFIQVLVDGVAYSPSGGIPTSSFLPGQVWSCVIYTGVFAVGVVHTIGGGIYSTPSVNNGFYGFNAVTGQSS